MSAKPLNAAKVAVTPLDGRLRLAETMEFAGLDTVINAVRPRAIQTGPSRYFVDWNPYRTPEIGPWAGATPMTPDGLPWEDASRNLEVVGMQPLTALARELLGGPNFAVAATVGSDGSPQQTIVWVRERDGEVIFSTVEGDKF